MGLAVFFAACGIGLLLGLLTSPSGRAARVFSIAGFAAALAGALLIDATNKYTIGDVYLTGGTYSGLFLACLAGAGLLLCIVGLGTSWPARLAPAGLAGLAGFGVALTASDAGVALTAAAAGAAVSAIVFLRSDATTPLEGGAVAEIRTLAVVVGALLVAAIAALRPAWAGPGDGAVFTLAFLGLGLAVAVRSGAVPFHGHAARLRLASSPMAGALLLVWMPAGLGVVALGWSAFAFNSSGDAMKWSITALQAIALTTIVFGAIGALVRDELEEIAAYSILQDSAFVLLALTTRTDAASEPARLWLLVFVAVKTALVAWVAATNRTFGTSNLSELHGWLRKTPILGLALVAIVAATLGAPGTAVYDARDSIVKLSLPGGLAFAGVAAILLSLAYYGRLLAVGLLPRSDAVLAARSELPHLHRGRAPQVAAAATAAATAEATAEATPEAPAPPEPLAGGRGLGGRIAFVWRLNRTLELSLVLAAGAALAVTLALGGLGARGASRSGIPLESAAHFSPSPRPIPTVTPRPTTNGIFKASPSPSAPASGSAGTGGSGGPGPLPSTGPGGGQGVN